MKSWQALPPLSLLTSMHKCPACGDMLTATPIDNGDNLVWKCTIGLKLATAQTTENTVHAACGQQLNSHVQIVTYYFSTLFCNLRVLLFKATTSELQVQDFGV